MLGNLGAVKHRGSVCGSQPAAPGLTLHVPPKVISEKIIHFSRELLTALLGDKWTEA